MKNLTKLFNECIADCDSLGIKYGHITNVSVNTRAKRRWGQTKTHRPYKYSTCHKDYTFDISISNRLLEDDVEDMVAKNTIMHEILHTVEDCQNHGDKWKAMADKVNRTYGYNVKRCTSSEEKGIEPVKITHNKNYVITCQKCGVTVIRHRMSDFVKYPYCYSHKGCGGYFVRVQ